MFYILLELGRWRWMSCSRAYGTKLRRGKPVVRSLVRRWQTVVRSPVRRPKSEGKWQIRKKKKNLRTNVRRMTQPKTSIRQKTRREMLDGTWLLNLQMIIQYTPVMLINVRKSQLKISFEIKTWGFLVIDIYFLL